MMKRKIVMIDDPLSHFDMAEISNLEMAKGHFNTQLLYPCVETATFKIKDLDQASKISVGLAQLFPDPKKVVLGISEILVNAIEHGNLGITYEEKSQLNIEGLWRNEIDMRATLPENIDKIVLITYVKKENEIILNVKDEGQGFEFSKYMAFDIKRIADNHGRGIVVAGTLSFDRLEYIGCGNEVNCAIKLQ